MSMLTPRGVGGHAPVRRGRRRRRLLKTLFVLVLIGAVAAGAWYLFVRDGATEAATTTPTPDLSATRRSDRPARRSGPAQRVQRNRTPRARSDGRHRPPQARLQGRRGRQRSAKRTVTGVAEVRSSAMGSAASRTVGAQVGTFVRRARPAQGRLGRPRRRRRVQDAPFARPGHRCDAAHSRYRGPPAADGAACVVRSGRNTSRNHPLRPVAVHSSSRAALFGRLLLALRPADGARSADWRHGRSRPALGAAHEDPEGSPRVRRFAQGPRRRGSRIPTWG